MRYKRKNASKGNTDQLTLINDFVNRVKDIIQNTIQNKIDELLLLKNEIIDEVKFKLNKKILGKGAN